MAISGSLELLGAKVSKRIALVFPKEACPRPISLANLNTDPRGLTGSESYWLGHARHLRKLGWDVTCFGNFSDGDAQHQPDYAWQNAAQGDWRAVVSYILPEPLKLAKDTSIRCFAQQCNDFNACQPGWESYTDYLFGSSGTQLAHLLGLASFDPKYARVLHDGFEPTELSHGERKLPRVKGRLLWASSHDRGLHWAFQCFQQLRQTFLDPATKSAYPPIELELRVAYSQHGMEAMCDIPPNAKPDAMAELGKRSRYCRDFLAKKPAGVVSLGSLSREQMAEEFAQADMLIYPCDPVSFTEGFGCTALEAMAHGAVPALNFVDAFPELWSGACPGVKALESYTSDGSRHPTAWLLREKTYLSKVRSLLAGLPADGHTLAEWRDIGRQRAEFFRYDQIVPHLSAFFEGDDSALPTIEQLSYPWDPR